MSFLFVKPVGKGQAGAPFFARLVGQDDLGFDGEEPTIFQGVEPEIEPIPPQEIEDRKSEISKNSQPSSQGPQPGSSQIGSQGPQAFGDIFSDIPIAQHGTGGSKSFSPLKREDLFDRDIIAKSTIKDEAQKQKSTITFDAKEFQYDGYMQRLKEKIEGIWHYPVDAAMRGISGDLYVDFTIKRDGSIGGIELVRTSGFESLDESAKKALKDAAPFWPLPEGWKKDDLTIRGHFIYSLYGTYLR